VYIDALIILNTVYNFFLLYLTGFLAACRPSFGRMMAGAFFASLCLLFLYFPQGSFLLTAGGKLLTALCLVCLVYKPYSTRRALFLWLLFLLVSFVTGGIILGINSLLPLSLLGSSAYILASPHPAILVLAPFLSLFMLRLSFIFSKNRQIFHDIQYSVIVYLGLKKVFLQAFLDTGNQLREPISGLPVLLASYQGLRELFPSSWREIWEGKKEEQMEKGEKIIGSSPLAPLFRLIPVQFMDNTQNLLWAFKPSKVEIINEHKRVREINELYIAICPELEAPLEKYEAILHPDILLEPSFSFKGGTK